MPKVVVKGESVYKCSVCTRSTRVPTNKYGLDVVQRCIITHECQGKMQRVRIISEINNTPAVPPEVEGVQDWFQRAVLHTHTQPVQSTKWVVKHNLASQPRVHVHVNRVVDGVTVLTKVTPLSEVTIDLNTIELTFSTPESGQAQCVALASRNTVNPPAVTTDTTASTIQISSNAGEITIATLSDSPTITVSLTYLASSTTIPVTIEYVGVDGSASIDSPWVGAATVVINGRRYTVRSFNLINTPLAPSFFATGVVASGAAFYVSAINGLAVSPAQCLMLLATSPFAAVDRITNQYIDVSGVSSTAPELYYSVGKAFASSTVVKSTYPHILVA